MDGLDTPSVLSEKKQTRKNRPDLHREGERLPPTLPEPKPWAREIHSFPLPHSLLPSLKKRPTQINNIVRSPPPSRAASSPRPARRAPALRQAATRSCGSLCGAAGAQQASRRRTMLPSAVAAHAGAYWDVVASSALLNLPAAPGFGNLGKSFLIENLLRVGGAPTPGLQPPAPHGPATALATAGAQLRPLPASPVPLKLCAAAEQVSPAGAPYGTRWAFQVLSPSMDSATLPGRAPGDRDCTFQPSAPGEPALPSLPSRDRVPRPGGHGIWQRRRCALCPGSAGLGPSWSISSFSGDATLGVGGPGGGAPLSVILFCLIPPIPFHQLPCCSLLSAGGRAP